MNKKILFDNILASSAFLKVNIPMMQRAGINEAIVMDELVQKSNYWENHRDIKLKYVNADSKYYKEPWFFTTYDDICDNTGLSRKKVIGAVSNLDKLGLIESDVPQESNLRTKWYIINFTAFDKFLKAGNGTVTKNTFSADRFIIYNKALSKKIGPVNTIILSDLYTSYMYTAEINNLIEGEWFPAAQKKLSDKLGKTPQTVCNKYIPALAETGLVDLKMMKFPRITHIKINFDKLYVLLGLGTNDDYINEDNEEVIDTYSEQERVTRLLLNHVKEISGITWKFDYEKVADIEDRLEEGYTEDELIKVIDHMYNYYKDQDKLDKMFNFKNVIGQKSKVEIWMTKIERDQEKEEERLYAEKVANAINNKMQEVSDGKIKYDIDANKIDMIRKRLAEELSEDELIEHATSRYTYLKEHGYDAVKNCSFNKLFGPKCFDDIQTVRNIKLKESAPKKKFKFNNYNGTRDSVNTNGDMRGISQEEVIRRAKETGEMIF